MRNRPRSIWQSSVLAVTLLLASQTALPAQDSCLDPCHPDATFDGSNCFFGEVPEKSSPFVLRNEIFYQPDPGGSRDQCAIGELHGAQCRVSGIPETAVAFVHGERLFHTSACENPSEWSDWIRLDSEEGQLEARAGHRRAHLRWQLKGSPEVERIEVLYGQAGAREDALELVLPDSFRHQILPWIVRNSCVFRRSLQDLSGAVEPERIQPAPDICRNGGILLLDEASDEAWLRNLRLDLTYRIEVYVRTPRGQGSFRLGPVFLTTTPR